MKPSRTLVRPALLIISLLFLFVIYDGDWSSLRCGCRSRLSFSLTGRFGIIISFVFFWLCDLIFLVIFFIVDDWSRFIASFLTFGSGRLWSSCEIQKSVDWSLKTRYQHWG
jgi:hypothetical protein